MENTSVKKRLNYATTIRAELKSEGFKPARSKAGKPGEWNNGLLREVSTFLKENEGINTTERQTGLDRRPAYISLGEIII